MAEIELGARPVASFDLTATPMESVTFAGPCVAICCVTAGPDLAPNGWRMTSIVTGYIGAIEAGSCGAIDFQGSVGHHSLGPATLTIAIPSGHHGKFVVTGGKPKKLTITLVSFG